MTQTKIAVVLLLGFAATTVAQTNVHVQKIEEEWELVVKSVDTNSSAPQVVCAIRPEKDSDKHALFLVNHRQYPQFYPGGLQLQMWNGEYDVARDTHDSELPLQNDEETVKWTAQMKLENGKLIFSIKDGDSQTWSDFDDMQVSISTNRVNLNKYSVTNSVSDSGASFAGNRIRTLKLKKVRYYLSDGTIVTDAQIRTLIDNN